MPENIDATLCTHIFFSFAKMCQGNGGWTLCPYEWNDQVLNREFNPWFPFDSLWSKQNISTGKKDFLKSQNNFG